MSAFLHKFRNFLGSRTFYWLILGVFVLQSLWIAFSALYPQAFDEDFHFGLIKVYSHYWLPFLGGQPDGGNAYGAVARDPSFLYHYLMSFPYRLIEQVTSNQVAQIIGLRVIDVGLFALGLMLFYKLIRRLGLTTRQANGALLVLTFIPIVPQLAGQVNYDDLLMPLAAWSMLLAIDVIDQIQKHRISLQSVVKLVTVCLVATMVKYEFLPIFAATMLFLLVMFWREFKGNWPDLAKMLRSYRKHPWLKKGTVLVVFLLIFSTFIQRDVVNLVKYHNVAPDCGYVLPIESCSQYPVWIHDYVSHQQVTGHSVSVSNNPVWYLWQWMYWLWYRLFFAINGPSHNFANYPPLPLPAAAFALLVIGSLVAIARYRKRLFRARPHMVFLAVVVAVYMLALLSLGFLKYRHTAVLELMNGRYLLPILLPGAVLGITALSYAFAKRPHLKLVVATVVGICFLQGGGVLTFISRSDPTWYWNNQTVRDMNHAAQNITHPLILDGSKTYNTTKWFFN